VTMTVTMEHFLLPKRQKTNNVPASAPPRNRGREQALYDCRRC